MVNPAFLTVEEVAERLGISKYQVYRRVQRGDLKAAPVRHHRSQLIIAAKDVEEYVAAGGPYILSAPKRVAGEWMSTREVAALTGHEPARIRQLCHDGVLVCRKGPGPRGQYRILRSSVTGFFKRSKRWESERVNG